jgi:hypothetical protein
MIMRKLALMALLVTGAYGSWPYLSLYEIQTAVQARDVPALSAAIDWDRLRDGLKQDVSDGITGVPGQAVQVSANSDDLPPFGSGFVNTMAGSMVDETVTPQHLASTVATLRQAGAQKMQVAWAFFTGPTGFDVSMRGASDQAGPPVMRLHMDLIRSGFGLRWKVTRVWLPMEMLAAAEPHAS